MTKNLNYNKIRKSILCISAFIFSILAMGGCGKADYADCFQVTNIIPVENDIENMIEIDYTITNIGGGDDKIFSITIDGKEEKYSIAPDSSKDGQIIIDIGRVDEYDLSYAVRYSVLKNNKEIWSSDDEIKYDCSDVFNHQAKVIYNGQTKEIGLTDYQFNLFDITELFSDFDPEQMHDVEVENANHDLVGVFLTEDHEGGFFTPSEGKYLIFGTRGYEETNDKYHYSNDLVINIKNATPAASVNWANYMEFVDDSHYTTSAIYGMTVTTFEMDVLITNPSDETVYGSVTKFYVNDKAVSDSYLAASEHRMIRPGETDKVYNYSGASIWQTTGETQIKKFGLKVKIEDRDGNILYNDIQWLYLK